VIASRTRAPSTRRPQGPAWPDERQALLLRAALNVDHDGRAAWERWKRGGGDVERLDRASYRLLPLLYRSLSAGGVDDPELPRLKGVYRRFWYTNQLLYRRAAEALGALADAGLETLVLKGAALSALHYRDPGARPMDDVDILVRTPSAAAAIGVLRSAGWTLKSELSVDRLVRSRHAQPLVHADGTNLDLHWRAFPRAARDDDIWRAAVPVTVGGVSSRALAPADQLLHVCVHGLGLVPAPGRWVADAVTVTRAAGDRLDWSRLVQQAVARRATLLMHGALRYLRDAFALPVPETTLAALRAVPTTWMERWEQKRALRPQRLGDGYMVLWDIHRGLRKGSHDAPNPGGYLSFLSDDRELTRRWELGPYVVRRLYREARARRSAGNGDGGRP
jgi:hypothetical protein